MREPDEKRFAELLLYISEKCATDPKFGATKLNKILFYADSLAFATLGNSITGFEYQKLPHGPGPRRIMTVQRNLEKEGAIEVREVPLRDRRTQKRVICKRRPKVAIFDPAEIKVVDEVIKQLRGFDAEDVSVFSHEQTGWQVARLHETIPYGTIFISDEALNADDIRRIQRFAEQHGYAAG
jgi:hypothetical protein